MTNLTKRQFEVVSFIASFIEEQGYGPSFYDIGSGVGVRSSATVHKHVTNLLKRGWLRREGSSYRSLQLTAEAEKALKRRGGVTRKVCCPKCEHKFEVRA